MRYAFHPVLGHNTPSWHEAIWYAIKLPWDIDEAMMRYAVHYHGMT
jgi:hypothetical protein